MKRTVAAVIVLGAVGWLFAGVALAQTPFQFKLGFKALADQIPEVVGQPLEEEHYGPNGDSLQQTTTGLMVWREADNWTAFTDGSTTWINGPYGVQSRLNSQRFEWEQSTPAPTPVAAPARGLILFEADWSGGMGGWPAVAGWNAVGGMLVNDGSTQGMAITAPVDLAGATNYAVEAEIQILNMPQYKRFGVVARGGYLGGIDTWNFRNRRNAFLGTTSRGLAGKEFDPGADWHKYRLEVSGNSLTLLIDGVVMAQATDNSFLSAGQVGIWTSNVQMNVRSFRVVAL